jgi:hypothetical protein
MSQESHAFGHSVLDVAIGGSRSVVHIARRDTIAGSLVSSFPQTLALERGPQGWVSDRIGRYYPSAMPSLAEGPGVVPDDY